MPNITKTMALCLVTNIREESIDKYCMWLEQVIQNGVSMVQLREKSFDVKSIRHKALALKECLKPFKIPLIINDHVYLASGVCADGVHIGGADMKPTTARNILGPDKIIGLSIESMQELEEANTLNCINYVAASAVFPARTKTNCKMMWGIDGLKKIIKISKHPVMAIGGIKSSNIKAVMQTGAHGVAVIGAIHNADSPGPETRKLKTIIDKELCKTKR